MPRGFLLRLCLPLFLAAALGCGGGGGGSAAASDPATLDSDGDGIPDYLEVQGFTYDAATGKLGAWDGVDHSVTYYKTDPHQRSTDQDPFDDLTEISGLNMDVSVTGSGGLPMVPALPEIVVRLVGYNATSLDQIDFTETSSIANGTTWENQNSDMDSRTTEHGWEVGFSATAKFGLPKAESEVTVHANYSGKISNTHETSTSHSRGGSVVDTSEWSQARSTKPSEAAAIKLLLKVENRGSACASGVVPTLSLRIGGHNVATFQPGATQINLLEPGTEYPAAPGVYWVVDSNQNGDKITLTMDELRALECGAPVTLSMTQMSAQVLRKDATTGAYVSLGDWNEYAARCRAVCADLYFDAGGGNYAHTLVYAGTGSTAPTVTLGDAFLWGIGGAAGGGLAVAYRDLDGQRQQLDLAGWTLSVDGGTWSANGLVKGGNLPEGFSLFDLRLNPGSVIFAKAPQVNPDPQYPLLPEIYYASYDSSLGTVSAVAGDYHGIAKVEFIDSSGLARTMAQDLPGSDFYIYYPQSDAASYPQGYSFTGTEKVRVTNVEGNAAEQTLSGIYLQPAKTAPDIRWATFERVTDSDGSRVYLEAEVVPDSRTVLDKVELFYPDSGSYSVAALAHVPDYYQRPYRWRAQLPDAASTDQIIRASDLAASTSDGLFSVLKGTRFAQTSPYYVGYAYLYAYYGWYWTDDWNSYAVDLDDGGITSWGWEEGSFSGENYPEPPDAGADVWLVYDGLYGQYHLRCRTGVTSCKLPAVVDYDTLTAQEAEIYRPSLDQVVFYPIPDGGAGDVFLIRTTEGRLAKVKLAQAQGYDPSGAYNRALWAKFLFSVFKKDTD